MPKNTPNNPPHFNEFDELINELLEGRANNPATHPATPSGRNSNDSYFRPFYQHLATRYRTISKDGGFITNFIDSIDSVYRDVPIYLERFAHLDQENATALLAVLNHYNRNQDESLDLIYEVIHQKESPVRTLRRIEQQLKEE